MKELEIIIDKGGLEKKIIISSGIIRFDNSENSITTKYKLSTIVIAGNGDYPPPFLKGSKVLRDIRESSTKPIDNWKLVLPLQQKTNDFFKFPINLHDSVKESDSIENWGVWISESLTDEFPDIMLINFPLWLISRNFKNSEFNEEQLIEILSCAYRTIMSALSATLSYLSINKKRSYSGTLALSDIGNNLIDKILISNISENDFFSSNLYKLRIRVFTQVLSEWLAEHDFYSNAVITYGDGVRMDLVERAWDIQAEESKNDIAEFGEALLLRNKNALYIKDLIQSTHRQSLKNALQMSWETLNSATPSLAADLIQCRTLVEAISHELCAKYDLNVQSANLFAYIQRIEESKKVSPWLTSYLHVIRQLGNEAAHYKNEVLRRPEKPVGKDLIVIHAALNRILSFCKDEQL
jgi:hypothetical protein